MERTQIIIGHFWMAVALVVMLLILSGCVTETRKEFYDNGQVKLDYKREGCIGLSDGPGKVINLPLSNPSVIGK